MRVLVLHGPNLNLLGRREPVLYGTSSLADVDASLGQVAATLGCAVRCEQSNHEGELIDFLHGALDEFDGVLLNAGAYSHTSLALADAVRAIAPLPVVEVHLTNCAQRGGERAHSVVGAACLGRIEGFGTHSYVLGLHALHHQVCARRS
ncbi:MAG: type II 3-dehydroquinate dehydratase [Myxococcota bacterium]